MCWYRNRAAVRRVIEFLCNAEASTEGAEINTSLLLRYNSLSLALGPWSARERVAKVKPAPEILEQEWAVVLGLAKQRCGQCSYVAWAGCLLNTSFCLRLHNFSQNHFSPSLALAGISVLLHLAAESTHNLYPMKARTQSSSTLAEK